MLKVYVEENGKKFEIEHRIINPKEYCKEFVKGFLDSRNMEPKDLKPFFFGGLFKDEKYGSDGDADKGELVKIIHFSSSSNYLEKTRC